MQGARSSSPDERLGRRARPQGGSAHTSRDKRQLFAAHTTTTPAPLAPSVEPPQPAKRSAARMPERPKKSKAARRSSSRAGATERATTREERYSTLRRRFSVNDAPELDGVRAHPQFDAFLRATAAELHDKHGGRKRPKDR